MNAQIDLACSIALENCAQGDYAGADFEYLYVGPGASHSKERYFQAIHGRDRHIYDSDTMNGLLDIFVKGVELASRKSSELRTPSLKGYRVIDPESPYML